MESKQVECTNSLDRKAGLRSGERGLVRHGAAIAGGMHHAMACVAAVHGGIDSRLRATTASAPIADLPSIASSQPCPGPGAGPWPGADCVVFIPVYGRGEVRGRAVGLVPRGLVSGNLGQSLSASRSPRRA